MRRLCFILGLTVTSCWVSSSFAVTETFAQSTIEWKLLQSGVSSQTVMSETQTNGSTAKSEQNKDYGVIEAESSFGQLKIYAESIREPSASLVGGRAARGSAWYIDEFVINGGVGIATTSLGVGVTGIRNSTADSGTGSNAGGYVINAWFNPNGVNTPIIDNTNPEALRNFQGTGQTNKQFINGTSGSFDFTYGVPFELKVLLSAYAQVDPVGTFGIPGNELQTHSIMNMGNTATTYFDLPDGASLSAASGTSYFLGPVPVPLPAAFWMLFTGLASLCGLRLPVISNRFICAR